MAATTPKKKPPKKTLDALLGEGKRSERTVEICLRADLQGEWEDLERTLRDAQQVRRVRMNDGVSEQRQAAERMEAIRQEMLDATVTFRLRALTRKRWAALMKDHPPTAARFAWNAETLTPALIKEAVYDPAVTAEQWARMLGEGEHDGTLTEGQFMALAQIALDMNSENPRVPFSSTASVVMRGIAPKSNEQSS